MSLDIFSLRRQFPAQGKMSLRQKNFSISFIYLDSNHNGKLQLAPYCIAQDKLMFVVGFFGAFGC